MASRIDTTRVQKAFRRAAKDPALAAIAVAVYQKPLRDGLQARLLHRSWPPNSPEWLAAKRRKGWGQQPWVRTGRTLQAITNNPPEKLGTRKGIKVGVNWRNAVAFLLPRTFTDAKGKRLPAKAQEMVFNTHRYGGAVSKIRSGWRAMLGRGGRESFRDYLFGTYGPKNRAQAAALSGHDGIPPRPLFAWAKEWSPDMTEDVEQAVQRILAKEGFLVRR